MKNIINCSCAPYSDISTITHSPKYRLIIVIDKIHKNIEISFFFSISHTPNRNLRLVYMQYICNKPQNVMFFKTRTSCMYSNSAARARGIQSAETLLLIICSFVLVFLKACYIVTNIFPNS